MEDNSLKKIENLVNAELSSKILGTEINYGELLFKISIQDILDVIKFLKFDKRLKFNQLIDIAAIDYPASEKRFQIVYLLLSIENNNRIKISTQIDIKEQISSITRIFPSANWMEREVFDMYGIKFTNHPDLRRILTDYGFNGYPLRKDFPLTGHNEVRYSEDEKKEIYEPVKLEQNYRNFDYESPWEGTKYINKSTKDK